MDTNALKKFAQNARQQLLDQVNTRLDQLLKTDSALIREQEAEIQKLKIQISKDGREKVVEEAAYTWFNRFCALRYMDVNGYNPFGIVSPIPGYTQPEVLQLAKQGIYESTWKIKDEKQIRALLDGSLPSPDRDQEAYRLLLLSACNAYNRQMSFLFGKIESGLSLLMPDDLLSAHSVLFAIREVLTAENCKDVEVIGWLYQFYNSERKDEVMAAKGPVSPEEIPLVTQLFTPDWIVQYMVQNSLGRLWLLNHPNSKIRQQMPYFIESQEAEADFIKISSPEEIKLLDPACGSGHILTYAFDLLYKIYEEEGYDAPAIPSLILQNNLFGIDIDKRACQLANFALLMKARQKDRRIFSRGIEPNILEMEDISFSVQERRDWVQALGQDLFTAQLWEGMLQFEHAKTFGSLIRPAIQDPWLIRERMQNSEVNENLFLQSTSERMEKVLRMSEYLSPRYQVVVANPPYFSKGMDPDYKQFAQQYYPDYKTDTFSMFIKRNTELAVKGGQLGFMSPFVWMFINSYENLRKFLIDECTITSLIQLEYGGFEGAVVPICTFTVENRHKADFQGAYVKLSDFKGAANQAPKTLEAIANPECGWFYRAAAEDFKKIPSSPIAYWASEAIKNAFFLNKKLGEEAPTKKGLDTGDNDRFLRFWHEINLEKLGIGFKSTLEFSKANKKWAPHDKGGEFCRWYGNKEYVINWENDGFALTNSKANLRSRQYYFTDAITWSSLTSGKISFRLSDYGAISNTAGSSLYPLGNKRYYLLALLNTVVSQLLIDVISPTLNYSAGPISLIPIFESDKEFNKVVTISKLNVETSKNDWDSYETSWDFKRNPLL